MSSGTATGGGLVVVEVEDAVDEGGAVLVEELDLRRQLALHESLIRTPCLCPCLAWGDAGGQQRRHTSRRG